MDKTVDEKLVSKQTEEIEQILDGCLNKLNSIEQQQNIVVKELGKKTDAIKITKVRKEIEAS
jgi:hypothetical protein